MSKNSLGEEILIFKEEIGSAFIRLTVCRKVNGESGRLIMYLSRL